MPYSEHSSFRELHEFCAWLQPSVVIPSVGNDSGEARDKMLALLQQPLQAALGGAAAANTRPITSYLQPAVAVKQGPAAGAAAAAPAAAAGGATAGRGRAAGAVEAAAGAAGGAGVAAGAAGAAGAASPSAAGVPAQAAVGVAALAQGGGQHGSGTWGAAPAVVLQGIDNHQGQAGQVGGKRAPGYSNMQPQAPPAQSIKRSKLA